MTIGMRGTGGGNSGKGSYGKYAAFKAGVINDFVLRNRINTVIEYGCGDGNQLRLVHYPAYTGFDISDKAVALCQAIFAKDATKKFSLMGDYKRETAELTMSLDVIFHLIEDDVFVDYMDRLFDSSERFVMIYSSDTDVNPAHLAGHVRHRNFSRWVGETRPEWTLMERIPNATDSFADFFMYERKSGV